MDKFRSRFSPAQRHGALLLTVFWLLSLLMLHLGVNDGVSFSLSGKSFTAEASATTSLDDEFSVLYAMAGTEESTLSSELLTLYPGTYRFSLEGACTAGSAVVTLKSPHTLNEDNTTEAVYLSASLAADSNRVSTEFTVKQTASDICLTVTLAPGSAFTLSHADFGAIDFRYRDGPLLAVLATLVFLSLLAVLLAKRSPMADGCVLGHPVSGRRLWFALAALFSVVTLLFCAPLLNTVLIGGGDYEFHVARLEGLATALQSGQFPVRIHGGTLNGYGYPNPIFYPELLLYFPAILRALGASLSTSWRILMLYTNFLTLLLGYLGFSHLLKSRTAGLSAALVYFVCPYRILLVYERSAVGEFGAMAFIPIVMYGLYAVIWGDEKDWPWLCAGMCGVFQCHILTTEMVALFCALAALFGLRRLFGTARRILPLLKAAVLMILLNVWFLVPMLRMMTQYSFDVFTRTSQLGGSGTLSDFLVFPAKIRASQNLGPAILLCLTAMALFLLLVPGAAQRRLRQIGGVTLFLGVLGVWTTSAWFPWDDIQRLGILRKLFGAMQFATRFYTVAMPLLAVAGGAALLLWLADVRVRQAAAAAVAGLALFTAMLTLQTVPEQSHFTAGTSSMMPTYTSVLGCIGQGEYIQVGTSLLDTLYVAPHIQSSGPNLTVSNLRRAGTTLSFDYSTDDGITGQYLLLPLSYFPTYSATVDGTPQPTQMDGNYLVRLDLTQSAGHVELAYREPKLFRLSEAVSLLVLAGCLAARPLKKRLAAKTHSSKASQ